MTRWENMTFKEKVERVRKQSDADIGRYIDVHPLAANYHRGYRDALEWVLEEIDALGK